MLKKVPFDSKISVEGGISYKKVIYLLIVQFTVFWLLVVFDWQIFKKTCYFNYWRIKMAYTQISGVVSKQNGNTGVLSFELDGKPVTIVGLNSNQVLDGHDLIVAGKQKDSGFSGIGYYDKTNGTTVKSLTQAGWVQIFIGGIIMFIGLLSLVLWFPLGIILFGLGGFYIWDKYLVANKYIDSLKKGVQ